MPGVPDLLEAYFAVDDAEDTVAKASTGRRARPCRAVRTYRRWGRALLDPPTGRSVQRAQAGATAVGVTPPSRITVRKPRVNRINLAGKVIRTTFVQSRLRTARGPGSTRNARGPWRPIPRPAVRRGCAGRWCEVRTNRTGNDTSPVSRYLRNASCPYLDICLGCEVAQRPSTANQCGSGTLCDQGPMPESLCVVTRHRFSI